MKVDFNVSQAAQKVLETQQNVAKLSHEYVLSTSDIMRRAQWEHAAALHEMRQYVPNAGRKAYQVLGFETWDEYTQEFKLGKRTQIIYMLTAHRVFVCNLGLTPETAISGKNKLLNVPFYLLYVIRNVAAQQPMYWLNSALTNDYDNLVALVASQLSATEDGTAEEETENEYPEAPKKQSQQCLTYEAPAALDEMLKNIRAGTNIQITIETLHPFKITRK